MHSKDYNLHNEMTFSVLTELSNFPSINLVVKDATREGKAFYDRSKASNKLGDSLVGWFGNEYHSPSLIDWSDCVIVIGGSIGIEVILQNKPLIYPTFLNTNKTLYEFFDAAHCVTNQSELLACLESIRKGEVEDKAAGQKKMISEIVYAGGEEFDVPAYYRDRIKRVGLTY